jgi:hypothetical protein
VANAQYGISNAGSVRVFESTLSGNGTGVIAHPGSTMLVARSTLGNNGRAVWNDEGTVAVSQSTLSGNGSSAVRNGGPISTTLKSTIIANTRHGPNCLGGARVTSEGHNLSDDGSCGLTEQGDKPNTKAPLFPLGDYGGPTQTFALRPSSRAIDAGVADGTTTDQRGLPRRVDYPGVATAVGGDSSDIGAFELQAP